MGRLCTIRLRKEFGFWHWSDYLGMGTGHDRRRIVVLFMAIRGKRSRM